MKDFDFVIIGGGCAGLSLAYELEINNNLKNKFTSFNLMNNDSIFTFNTWEEFYKQ